MLRLTCGKLVYMYVVFPKIHRFATHIWYWYETDLGSQHLNGDIRRAELK